MSKSERLEIGVSKKKYSLRTIARMLSRSVSTISDELSRNHVNGRYDAAKAHHKAYVRRHAARYQGKKIVHHPALKKEVDARLLDDQSPKNIAGHISRYKKSLPSISKDSIYRYIKSVYGRKIETHRWMRKKRRHTRRTRCTKLPNRRFIGQRPKHINTRKHIGDTEADFIVSGRSGKGILLVVVDRRSRAPFLELIPKVSIAAVHRALARIKQRFPEMHTMTTDNDILWGKHRDAEELLRIKIYFCHPYHSWEKGTVERVNGVVRRDYPKGTNFSRLTRYRIRTLEEKLQRAPLEVLGYLSPAEVLRKYRKRIMENKKHP